MIHVIHGIGFSWCCVDVLGDYYCRVIVLFLSMVNG